MATTFANITLVTNPSNHFPFGSLDCNGSGCHTTSNVNAGGFKLGAASLMAPTLSVAGHTRVAAAVAGCQTCHESAPYIGMIVSSATAWGDSRPQAFDKAHPATGDCNGCHTTTPTFMTDQTGNAKPANHIPTSAPCAQCHTTAGNYAAYSVTGTHQGVTGCLSCHGSTVATTFANITCGRLQARRSEPHGAHALGGRPYQGRGRGRRLPDLSRERALHRHDREQRDRLGRLPSAGLRQGAPGDG
ncbi:MAG: hypothetical protein E6K31_05340 [Gammaproteobacteria bacterium]|nr:MAG: hypothetical protein E6K31_05340 [Gammaproteobacteria bacterium]